MTKTKSTKRALLLSALSLLMCVSMLIGSTYAWFTDEVTSANNVIKSGTLEIGFDWANGKEAPASANWIDASEGAIFNNDLWEPGYTEARHIKITNKGTLALNWDLAIAANGEVSALGDVIDVYCTKYSAKQINDRDVTGLEYKGTLTEWISTSFAKGSLEAGKEYTMTVVLKMREEAGNEYQNLSIGSDFAIKLLATQRAYESDSFDKNYDEFAGKTVVTPETAQAAIEAAQEGDIIYLEQGSYETLVLKNADGSPKKGITIEHKAPGVNPTSAPFNVGQIDLNGSEDITIRGIYFDIDKAEPVYKKDGTATGYVASIVGSGAGVNVGAKNIVIDNCKFNATSNSHPDYVAICFEEQGKPTSRATNITVINCMMDKSAFNFIRANYLAEGTVTIEGNALPGGTTHSALNFTGNAANLKIRNNTFGFETMSGRLMNTGWNVEKAMLGTSRQGSNKIMIEVTGNTFIQDALVEGEGHVIELKSSYTADNCELIFEGNTFKAGLAGMTEDTVPCIWHN